MGCFVSKERENYEEGPKERQFMHCVVRVNQKKKGWNRSVGKLLNSMEVREGDMRRDDELIVLSGTAVPRAVLRVISNSSKLKLESIQYGQCSALLFGPHRSTFKKPPPAPPVEESAPPPSETTTVTSEIGYPFPNYDPACYPRNYGGYYGYPRNYGGYYSIA